MVAPGAAWVREYEMVAQGALIGQVPVSVPPAAFTKRINGAASADWPTTATSPVAAATAPTSLVSANPKRPELALRPMCPDYDPSFLGLVVTIDETDTLRPTSRTRGGHRWSEGVQRSWGVMT